MRIISFNPHPQPYEVSVIIHILYREKWVLRG